jgi:hypothetical protein
LLIPRRLSHRLITSDSSAPIRRSERNTRTKHNYAELDGDVSIPRPDLDDGAVEIECFNGIRVLRGDRNRSVDFFFRILLVLFVLYHGALVRLPRGALLSWATIISVPRLLALLRSLYLVLLL